jgi:hypothetical protein
MVRFWPSLGFFWLNWSGLREHCANKESWGTQCHMREFARDSLQSRIRKVLRVHHFGYPHCVFLDTAAFLGQTTADQ